MTTLLHEYNKKNLSKTGSAGFLSKCFMIINLLSTREQTMAFGRNEIINWNSMCGYD
jgi:hypothetical protein